MSELIPITMTAEDVGVLASVVSPSDWARCMFNGTALLVPGDLYNTINGMDIAASKKNNLIAYAAAKRFNKEVGGIVVNGAAIATDRQSQAMINGAYNMATNDANFTTQWKVNNTTFVLLTAAQIIGIAIAVGTHVAACFAQEATAVAGINANTITTAAQVDQAFA